MVIWNFDDNKTESYNNFSSKRCIRTYMQRLVFFFFMHNNWHLLTYSNLRLFIYPWERIFIFFMHLYSKIYIFSNTIMSISWISSESSKPRSGLIFLWFDCFIYKIIELNLSYPAILLFLNNHYSYKKVLVMCWQHSYPRFHCVNSPPVSRIAMTGGKNPT